MEYSDGKDAITIPDYSRGIHMNAVANFNINAIDPRFRAMAEATDQHFDEHGSKRGDYLSTEYLDYVSPPDSLKPPYHDYGVMGLGLIRVHRKRVYASSCQWYPKKTFTAYLLGRNESGTYFAHPVDRKCFSVRQACHWIWNKKADRIIMRQGDIALIKGTSIIKVPDLPSGHTVEGDYIVHDSHPALHLPRKGERVIVAKRAVIRVSNATRD